MLLNGVLSRGPVRRQRRAMSSHTRTSLWSSTNRSALLSPSARGLVSGWVRQVLASVVHGCASAGAVDVVSGAPVRCFLCLFCRRRRAALATLVAPYLGVAVGFQWPRLHVVLVQKMTRFGTRKWVPLVRENWFHF